MIKLIVFCFVVTLLTLHCNIAQEHLKPHELHILIENKANVDTIYAGVTKNYTISIVDEFNDTVQLALITPVNGCILNSSKGQLSWLPGVDDTGRVNLKIEAKDEMGNADTLSAEYVVALGNNFCPIAIGNKWQYSYEYLDACINSYGGIKKVSTIDIKILSTERHSDSLFFSFERNESGFNIHVPYWGSADSPDTSDYLTLDTIMMFNFNNRFYYRQDISWVENNTSNYPYFFVNFPSENLSYDNYNSDSQLKYSTNNGDYGDNVQYYNGIGMVNAQLKGGLQICGITRQTYQLVSYQIN
jgi:hypothetical protein